MEITLNVDVDCKDGHCGRATYVIINPITKKVTHFVVRDHAYPHTERILPVAQIRESSHDGILLKTSRQAWRHMTPFFAREFIEIDSDDGAMDADDGALFSWPYVSMRTKHASITKKQMPLDAIDVRRGARVDATDGRIGRVDEFLVDPDTMNITHLVMTEGHLWGEKDIVIPLGAIKEFGERVIKLNLTRQEVEALPTVPIHRHFTPVGV